MKQKEMNVKELKAFLVKQFQDSASDIQWLMSEDYNDLNYNKERWFRCSEYDLIFKAIRNSYNGLVELDFDSNVPNIELIQNILDLSSEFELRKELHYFERIEFKETELKFLVEQYSFTNQGYEIKLKNDSAVWKNELSFLLNSKTVKYSTNHFEFEKSDTFFASCQVKMKRAGVAYHQLDLKNDVFPEMSRVHRELRADKHIKDKICDLFVEFVSKPISEWFMKDLCLELQRELCI